MSFEYWFESDRNLDSNKLKELFIEAGADIVSDPNKAIQAFYSDSGLSVWEHEVSDGQENIKSEDTQGLEFQVGCRCVFRFDSYEYDKKVYALEAFMNGVYDDTGAKFIVSFQLEKIHYINRGEGVERCA